MKTTAPGQSALLLVDIIAVLNKKKIPYAVIGAFAAAFYGVVRASLDADAVVSLLTSEAIIDLCDELRSKRYSVIKRKGDFNDPIAMVINIKDRFSNRVDLLMGIRGMGSGVFSRVKRSKFMDTLIKIVSLEDFIAMKVFAGNPIDIEDAISALKVSERKVDIKLLQKTAAAYGADVLKKLKVILSENISRKI
ncbi:MAG: hypothetical protein KGI24_03660 [Candidatus Omnitrophica bacterium]|nr:hypothetical protein [Candidatus Omnitrophota bacterium]